jgi:hypothetical protein
MHVARNVALFLLLAAAGVAYYREFPERLPTWAYLKLNELSDNIRAGDSPAPRTDEPEEMTATLYLVNGGVATGTLLREGPDSVTLHGYGGDIEFKRQEIRRMVKESEEPGGAANPPAHEPGVR